MRCTVLLLAAVAASFKLPAAPIPARAVMSHRPPPVMLFKQKETAQPKGKTIQQPMVSRIVKVNKENPEKEDSASMMQKVKDAGVAGIISYIFWEWAFWGVSVPVALFGFKAAVGYWPDFQNTEDMAKLGAEAFAFVNVARFAVPLRIGLALGTTPWVQTNIVDKFQKKEDA